MDVTGVVGRVKYYVKKNFLIAFSSPLTSNGFTDSTASNARTAKDIFNQFDNYDRARLAYLNCYLHLLVD